MEILKTRTFIAINLPLEVKNKLSQIQEKIKKECGQKNIKWVSPQNFHFTLHFLGYLTAKEIDLVKNILKQTLNNQSLEIILKIKEKNCFPHLKRARVMFFAGEEKKGNLKKLQKKIGQKLKTKGFKIDERPWKIHLTWARAINPLNFPDSFKKIQELEFKVDSIDLMKSELRRSGPIYTILEKYPL